MTISPVEFYAKPDAKDARIAELEEALRDAHKRLLGAGMLGGKDDPVRTALKEKTPTP